MSSAGELLVVGLEGPRLTREERRILEWVSPGGVVLFARNLPEVRATRELLAELRAILPETVLCVDSEGGRVDRLRRLVGPAPAAGDLAWQRPAVSQRAGRWVGASLRAFGFDLDFAPVADLDHGRIDNALDRRCFGTSPRAVVSRAGAFLEGLHAAGVGGCLKHFPGLGGAGVDTHRLPSEIELSSRGLERDLAPFARLLPRADSVMVGHASYPGWDPSGLPATFSRAIATDLIRRRLGFDGIVFTDDLEMEALGRWGDLADRAERSLTAGCDGLLICRRLDEVPRIAERLASPALRPRREEAGAGWQTLRQSLETLRARAARPLCTEREIARGLTRLAASLAQNGMSSSPGGR